jgi:hypothetical protein
MPSASITGIEVSEPCPISVAGDMMNTVPSVETVTHAFTTVCLGAAAANAAPAFMRSGTPATTPNVSPAAPTMNRRRPCESGSSAGFIYASFAARSIARTMRT